MTTRRELLRVAGAGAAVALAGCAGGRERSGGSEGGESGDGESTATPVRTDEPVVVGPDGKLTFDPVAVAVPADESVTWRFDSAGHNVSAKSDASGEASLPEGAAPFASYEGENHYATVAVGETLEHTFDVAGEYTYVCTPHVMQGMIGRVVVTE